MLEMLLTYKLMKIMFEFMLPFLLMSHSELSIDGWVFIDTQLEQ